MSISANIIQLISHTRKTVEELANTYHQGGAWGDNGLPGYCGIASRFLIALFRRNGIHDARLVCGFFHTQNEQSTHCWVEYDKFCIDLTISQFDFDIPFRICLVGDAFYRKHYRREMIGSKAVILQKEWDDGQNYESCASLLWRIHKTNYIREYNGLVLR